MGIHKGNNVEQHARGHCWIVDQPNLTKRSTAPNKTQLSCPTHLRKEYDVSRTLTFFHLNIFRTAK